MDIVLYISWCKDFPVTALFLQLASLSFQKQLDAVKAIYADIEQDD